MKKFLFFSLLFGAFLTNLSAQNIAGTYAMTFTRANQVYLDRSPVSDPFSGSTTFTITQSGDEITVTMSGFGSEWSAHVMKGRVGNNRFVAVLANGDKSVYTIQGAIKGNQIEGEYMYIRYGDGSSGIVPGWHRVTYTATR